MLTYLKMFKFRRNITAYWKDLSVYQTFFPHEMLLFSLDWALEDGRG